MKSFQWSDGYVVGIDSVDEQHQRLVDIINRIFDLLTSRHNSSFPSDEIIHQLDEYANYHFSEEETLMLEKQIDARHYEGHKMAHDGFIAQIQFIQKSLSLSEPDILASIYEFLVSWLTNHILGTDQSMSRQLVAIDSGVSADEAYRREISPYENSNKALVSAFNTLFHLVVEKNNELRELNRTLEKKVEERTRELATANQNLEKLSLTDMLTGLPNRRNALRYLDLYWQESETDNKPLSCMMIDADQFKEVNDHHGHDAGDNVLVALANRLRDAVRTDDMVCRLGGDEFLLICPNTGLENALSLGESLREQVSTLRVQTGAGYWPGSVSIGVASRSDAIRNFESLIKKADESVYLAKKAGKNCVRSVQV